MGYKTYIIPLISKLLVKERLSMPIKYISELFSRVMDSFYTNRKFI